MRRIGFLAVIFGGTCCYADVQEAASLEELRRCLADAENVVIDGEVQPRFKRIE